MKYLHVQTWLGCRIYKLFVYLFLGILFIFPFVVVGFFFIPGKGELYGLALAITVMAALFVVGDKLLLSLSGAKRFHGRHSIKNSIKNMCCRLGLATAVYFESEVLDQDLVLIKLPWGQIYIVYGSKLRSSLVPEEQNQLIWAGLQQVKSGNIQALSLVTLLSYPYYVVLLWLEKIKVLATLKLFVHFMLYPYFIFREMVVKKLMDDAAVIGINLNDQERRMLLSVATKRSSLVESKHLLKELISPNIIAGERFIRDDDLSILSSESKAI